VAAAFRGAAASASISSKIILIHRLVARRLEPRGAFVDVKLLACLHQAISFGCFIDLKRWPA